MITKFEIFKIFSKSEYYLLKNELFFKIQVCNEHKEAEIGYTPNSFEPAFLP